MSMLFPDKLKKPFPAEPLFMGARIGAFAPFLMSAVLLCTAFPSRSQELPEGKGKEIVLANCNSCHTFYSRVGAGYTAKGWDTVMRMMANHGN